MTSNWFCDMCRKRLDDDDTARYCPKCQKRIKRWITDARNINERAFWTGQLTAQRNA